MLSVENLCAVGKMMAYQVSKIHFYLSFDTEETTTVNRTIRGTLDENVVLEYLKNWEHS